MRELHAESVREAVVDLNFVQEEVKKIIAESNTYRALYEEKVGN